MKLRTFTGVDKETTCACGCRQRILARPDSMVTVDMESYPRKRYIPGHAGNGYGSTTYAKREPKPKEEAKPAPTPAPAPPAPIPPQPQTEPTPSPTPKAVGSVTPSLADNRPWSLVMVTVCVGPYESVKVGSADFGTEGETLTQVRERIAREVAAELDRQVRALQALHGGKPSPASQGVAPATLPTLSLAKAGAPTAESKAKDLSIAEAMRAYYNAGRTEVKDAHVTEARP